MRNKEFKDLFVNNKRKAIREIIKKRNGVFITAKLSIIL